MTRVRTSTETRKGTARMLRTETSAESKKEIDRNMKNENARPGARKRCVAMFEQESTAREAFLISTRSRCGTTSPERLQHEEFLRYVAQEFPAGDMRRIWKG